MSTGHYIVTGSSRGIGEQLSRLLLGQGNFVYGISRGIPESLKAFPNYRHISFDLNRTGELESMLQSVIDSIPAQDEGMIGLINNAAMLEPLQMVDQCSTAEIERSLQITLAAPIILSASFIRLTEGRPVRKKIVNVSSGSATYPAPAMSIYCAAKSGINMFTRCIGAEQANRPGGVEVIAVDPGMVDTEMQQLARSLPDDSFPMAAFFRQAHEQGQLYSAEQLGERLMAAIEQRYEPGELVKL
ncbi:SDR family NAD(P)-dependent oxidoreductase [Paenibacillus kobensis]|uniref:SDR family NAD(P)-dependent oxidoreductase n=1 Tax=Paenibacillus kobensis TaxID=59841 RepID=UPI000FDB45F6|nr:SDR family NAD(P)-dependent oxidoreductase [Paenibacillus kobensis]